MGNFVYSLVKQVYFAVSLIPKILKVNKWSGGVNFKGFIVPSSRIVQQNTTLSEIKKQGTLVPCLTS